MLYNKNSVRKTNDKKILHKVGKQWKVVSVALLMAIGGGAAVAATNNANANADANNGVTQETQATVNSLEAGPQIGQSSAPASASSKASSASSAAPVMPQLSLNPDPSLNGNNASAEFARVKQGYDHAVVGYYGKLVNSYVNLVNSNYSASANSVNSKFASASNKQSNDTSSASSFAAVASGKDWMNEVDNIAKAKSGVTGSEFIDAVQYNTTNNTAIVSSDASTVSAASAVVSAAQLVSGVIATNGNNGYKAQAISAYAASNYYHQAYLTASTAYNNAVNASGNNQTASANAYYVSLENSIADSYALQNANSDTSATSSLANAQYNKNYASASSAVSSMAVKFNAALNHGETNQEVMAHHDKRNNQKPGNQVSQTKKDLLNAFNVIKRHNIKLSGQVSNLVNNAYNYAHSHYNVTLTPNEVTLLTNKANTVMANNNIEPTDSVSISIANVKGEKGKTFTFNDPHAGIHMSYPAQKLATKVQNAINRSVNPQPNPWPVNPVTPDFGELNTLVSDTAAEQRYGSVKSSCDNIMNSAKAASASDAAAVTSASDAMTSNSAKAASASSAYTTAYTLATAQNLDAVNQIVPSDVKTFAKYYNGLNGALNAENTTKDTSAVSNAVSNIASEANNAGSQYTSASNSSENYAKSTDANFVLASYYASSYSAMSNDDAKEFNVTSAARDNFYNTYAGHDFAGDNAQLTSAEADEPNQGALANGYARYVQIHEPHVVTVTNQLVLHANPNYNDKTDTPADAKLAVINKGTHLLVQNVGFDKHGNTRLYVNYDGKKGFITGLRNYVADSYLVPGQKYNVTFNRTVNQYKGLQFNKSNATKLTVSPKETVTGTAVLNDDPHYWNGLTRLQLSNGNFVTTLDSMIQSATPVNNNGQATESKGAYFWNGQDNIFKK